MHRYCILEETVPYFIQHVYHICSLLVWPQGSQFDLVLSLT